MSRRVRQRRQAPSESEGEGEAWRLPLSMSASLPHSNPNAATPWEQLRQRSAGASRMDKRNTMSLPSSASVSASASSPATDASILRLAVGPSIRSVLLPADPPLTPEEAQKLIRATVGSKEPIIGLFEVDRQIIFPLSLVCSCPSAFSTHIYYPVTTDTGVLMPTPSVDHDDTDTVTHTHPGQFNSRAQRSPDAPRQPVSGSRQAFMQQRQIQQQPHTCARAHAALDKAKELSRIAAQSPVDGEQGSDEDDEDEYDDSDTSESSDVSTVDEAEEDAAFEEAVHRSLQAVEIVGDPAAVMRGGLSSPGSSPVRLAATATNHRNDVGRQRWQNQNPNHSTAASYGHNHKRWQYDGENIADEGDYYDEEDEYEYEEDESDEIEAARQSAWDRERDRLFLEAEERLLHEDEERLKNQRAEVEALKRHQDSLLQQRNATLAKVRANEAKQRAILNQVKQLQKQKADVQTALMSARYGRPEANKQRQSYSTFAEDEESDDDDEEEEDENEDEDDSGHAPLNGHDSSFADSPSPSFRIPPSNPLVLSPRELHELEDLQLKTGFGNVSPSQLFHLFQSAVLNDGTLPRSSFDVCAEEFLEMAQVIDESHQRKALLVLNRLVDLFDADEQGIVPWCDFATGLSIMCMGDRDEKVALALRAFDPTNSGILPFSAVERYFSSFFTVVFDLSVSLQESILTHTTCDELAHATAKQLFHQLSQGRQTHAMPAAITIDAFRRWYSSGPTMQQQRIIQEVDEEDEDDDDEGHRDHEDDEYDAVETFDPAAYPRANGSISVFA